MSNAGSARPGSFLKVSLDDQIRTIDLNVTATVHMAHTLGAQLLERGRGGYILIGSTSAFGGVPFMATYAASKAFVGSLGEALRVEWKSKGVDVLVVHPGPTRTEMVETDGVDFDSVPMPWMSAQDVVGKSLRSLGKRGELIPRSQPTYGIQPNRFNNRSENQTMSSTTISKSIIIEAPKDRVWRALADFGSISTWNPNVNASKLTSPQPGGLGATRQCNLAPMGIVDERIVQWDEERILGIEVYEMQKVPGMRQATASFKLSDGEQDGQRTSVVLTMGYEIGMGVLGSTMNALGMRRQFSKAATGLLAGLKHHVETGASVTGKSKLPTSEVLTVG